MGMGIPDRIVKLDKAKIGSMTAKDGFINENEICNKFKNYKTDKEANNWLSIMGYDPNKIQILVAVQIPVKINLLKAISFGVLAEKYEETIKFQKADIQIKIEIIFEGVLYVENISLKKANISSGFNQVDKRPVLAYMKMWGFSEEIANLLRLFTGELSPENILSNKEFGKIKDKRRLFLNEMPLEKQNIIIKYFKNNKTLIVSDILRGRGGLSVEWLLVTRRGSDGSIDFVLKDINTVCNFYAQGEVAITDRGNLRIGRVTMQRKGGTPDPTSLQFKINPLKLFGET